MQKNILIVFLFLFFHHRVIGQKLSDLSLEEKIGQLLIVQFCGEKVTQEAKQLIEEVKVGGFIYYNWSNGLSSPKQVATLSQELQQLAKIPLFIAVDQEGGIVCRLKEGFTDFPGNYALGKTKEPLFAYLAALSMAKEMKAVGINLNFAPVIDVNSQPKNPVIHLRAFSSDTNEVIAFGEKALKGFSERGILTTIKHFPGHGDVTVDSHHDLPLLNKSLTELKQLELKPFQALCKQSDLVMTAHLLVPALDPDWCTTLSKKSLDYLKEELGFTGVIISDSLVMKGVLKKCKSVEKAAAYALNAGCDLLLLGGRELNAKNESSELKLEEIERVHTYLVNAVKKGEVAEARVNEAVTKVLALKKRIVPLLSADNLTDSLNSVAHQLLAKEIAKKALKIVENSPEQLFPLAQKKALILAPSFFSSLIKKAGFLKISRKVETCFFNDFISDMQILQVLDQASKADYTILFLQSQLKNSVEISIAKKLIAQKSPFILVATDETFDLLNLNADLIVQTYSRSQFSFDVLKDYLEKRGNN